MGFNHCQWVLIHYNKRLRSCSPDLRLQHRHALRCASCGNLGCCEVYVFESGNSGRVEPLEWEENRFQMQGPSLFFRRRKPTETSVDVAEEQRKPGMRDQNVPAEIKSRRSIDERGAKEGRRGLIQHENCFMPGEKMVPFSRYKESYSAGASGPGTRRINELE